MLIQSVHLWPTTMQVGLHFSAVVPFIERFPAFWEFHSGGMQGLLVSSPVPLQHQLISLSTVSFYLKAKLPTFAWPAPHQSVLQSYPIHGVSPQISSTTQASFLYNWKIITVIAIHKQLILAPTSLLKWLPPPQSLTLIDSLCLSCDILQLAGAPSLVQCIEER